MQSAMRPVMLYILPGAAFVGCFWLPVALQLTFMCGTAFGILQAFTFRQPWFRKAVGMTPMNLPTVQKPAPAPTDAEFAPLQDSNAPDAMADTSFTNNPFANLRTTGHTSRIRYQAPTAQATLSEGLTPAASPAPVLETEQPKGVLGRMKKEFAPLGTGLKSFGDGVAEKMGKGEKKLKGDRGRSKTFVQQAQAHEMRKRGAEGKKGVGKK